MADDKLLDYEYKTDPFDHQRETLEAIWRKAAFAIFWEQGTGKTKHILDNAAALYESGEIDCLFVVAPNGVHRNWVAEEIGKHIPDRVMRRVKSFAYHSSKANTKRHKKAAEEILLHKGLAIIAISYSAFMTTKGKPYAKKVLAKRECFYILDESAFIKTPGSKRSKAIVASGKYSEFKRILTGTPVSNKPFDIYTQMKFLDPDFWKVRGLGNFFVFKNYFALFMKQELSTGGSFQKLLEYRNLPELHNMIQDMSSRVLKDDVLDLPPKLYSKRFFDMSPTQGKLYRELRDEFMAELEDDRGSVSADLAITRMLRLQQITCGYVSVEVKLSPDPDDPDYLEYVNRVRPIESKNLRMKLLEEIVETLDGKAIIWARFTNDIDMIMDLLGERAVRYDGKTKTDARADAIGSFQHDDDPDNPGAQFFVANTSAAGTGITLTKATTVVYYNNDFKLDARLQSEDRCHRIGTTQSVNYIDIVANGTIDEHIINTLLDKKNVASIITGDAIKEWL